MQSGISKFAWNQGARSRILRGFGLGIGCSLALASSAQELPEKYQALIRRDPFRPPAAATPSAAPQPSVNSINYRFTGYMVISGTIWVGVENVPQQRNYVMAAGQEVDGVGLKEVHVDAEKKSILLSVGGDTFPLELNEMPMPIMQPPPTTMQAQPQMVTTPAGTGTQISPPVRRRTIVPPRR